MDGAYGSPPNRRIAMKRRRFVTYFSQLGLSATLLPGVLWSRLDAAETTDVTAEMLAEAERVAGIEFTDSERELMLRDLNERLNDYAKIRAVPLQNGVAPALEFQPLLPHARDRVGGSADARPCRWSIPAAVDRPQSLEQVAFWPVTKLAALVRSRKVSSMELTKMYLSRLKRFDAKLHSVVTLTEKLALQQARRADEEIAAGRYRGPLHGIPWGAKDLLATRGYKTTWGAMPFKEQTIDADATVVKRLAGAGAVLVAKLALGALAWGDVWFGGQTRNPWNLRQGSSGSSAGSAAATAAGLVGFAIGTETMGSLVSPATRCGVTALRPTFGRVSRAGAMALSWSMDKIGPMCRSVEDCAVVFDAIRGPDQQDGTVVDLPFRFDVEAGLQQVRVGYVAEAFASRRKKPESAVLTQLRSLGVKLREISLPAELPVSSLYFILQTEAAAAFDALTRDNRDDLMVRQERHAWPNVFRHARMIPAVEYIQAQRVRRLLMEAMEETMQAVDVYVSPTFGNGTLRITNFTGHPCVVLPCGFDDSGAPVSITFTGRLFGEAELLAVARAYQEATDFHLRHPEGF